MQIREQLYKAGELGTTVMIGLGKARKLPGKLMNSSLKFVDDMKVSSLKKAESLLDTVSAKASKIATKFDDFAFDTVRVADTGFGNVLIKDSVRLSDTPLGGRVQQMFTKLSDDAAEMSNSVAKASDDLVDIPKSYLDEALKQQGLDNIPSNLKQKWTQGDYKYEVRVHPGESAHTDSKLIYRVERQKSFIPGQQGSGKEYMDINGKWWHQSELREFNRDGSLNSMFNHEAAKNTHIPVGSK